MKWIEKICLHHSNKSSQNTYSIMSFLFVLIIFILRVWMELHLKLTIPEAMASSAYNPPGGYRKEININITIKNANQYAAATKTCKNCSPYMPYHCYCYQFHFSQKYCLLSISKGALILIVHCGSLSNNSSSFYSTHHEK